MSKPILLRLAPLALRTKLYYHLYRGKTKRPELFLHSLGYRVRRLDGGPNSIISEFEAFTSE
jgi:hypothetical protein